MPERPRAFNPYAILETLDRRRVDYVLIGAFARVLQGTEEVTRGIDIVPSTRTENVDRLNNALQDLGATEPGGRTVDISEETLAERPVISLNTDHGELNVVSTPEGTRGFDDLRRGANREPLGRGLRPRVASIGDLARMASALDRERFFVTVMQLRRLTALEHSRSRVIER
jgi:hypothetical protein